MHKLKVSSYVLSRTLLRTTIWETGSQRVQRNSSREVEKDSRYLEVFTGGGGVGGGKWGRRVGGGRGTVVEAHQDYPLENNLKTKQASQLMMLMPFCAW